MQRCCTSSAPDGQSPKDSGPPPAPSNSSTPQGFTSLEKLVSTQAVQQTEPGGRTDWLEVEGAWVLRPPPEAGRPRAVAFFCGGAFAGAAPQLTYRLLLECLTRRNILVSLRSCRVLVLVEICSALYSNTPLMFQPHILISWRAQLYRWWRCHSTRASTTPGSRTRRSSSSTGAFKRWRCGQTLLPRRRCRSTASATRSAPWCSCSSLPATPRSGPATCSSPSTTSRWTMCRSSRRSSARRPVLWGPSSARYPSAHKLRGLRLALAAVLYRGKNSRVVWQKRRAQLAALVTLVLKIFILLLQLSTSPARSALINALEGLRRTSPSLVRQFLPVLDQLEPIFASLADGTQQFVPHPEETAEQLRTQYGALFPNPEQPIQTTNDCLHRCCNVQIVQIVQIIAHVWLISEVIVVCAPYAGVPRNLIIQFDNDTIDESPRLHAVLQSNSTVARQLRYTVRTWRVYRAAVNFQLQTTRVFTRRCRTGCNDQR